MTSEFWKNDPKDNYRIFKDKRGRTVVKVVTPSGVVALISTDIPVTTIRALKDRIKGRILLREQGTSQESDDDPGAVDER
jgi:uncharacterized linocin/CFP29 family protein